METRYGHRKSVAGGFAILLVLALLAVACGGGGGDNGGGEAGEEMDPVAGGSLAYGIEGETDSWNPATGQWSASSWAVVSAIFESLMYFDENYELKPYLAESMEPNDDFTVWTMKLRPDITFQNGEELNADVLMMNMDEQKKSPLTANVLGPVLSYEKVDDLTVRFELANTWVQFPIIFASQIGMMAAPEMIAMGEEAGLNPIGTGPFAFDQWTRDASLKVVAYPDYWRGAPYLESIEFKILADALARGAAMSSGEIDVALVSASPDVVKAFQSDDSVDVHRNTEGEVSEVFMIVNQQREPWNDLELRRALVMATDTQLMVDTLAEGIYEPARGIWAPSSPWYVETDYPEYNPDEARRIVEEWERENGEDLTIEMIGPSWPIVVQGGQLLQEMWGQVGIDVEVVTIELTQHILRVVTGDYEGAVWQFHSSPHPDGEFVFLHSQYIKPPPEISLNFARNDNPAIDEALLEARFTDDVERQKELYGIVQKEFAEDVPYIFLWHARDGIAVKDHVHDMIEWELPTGEPALGLYGTRQSFAQVWIEQ